MALPVTDPVAGIAAVLDRIIPDPAARDAAKLELLRLDRARELGALCAEPTGIPAEASDPDRWTARARPSFLYVMYALLLAYRVVHTRSECVIPSCV